MLFRLQAVFAMRTLPYALLGIAVIVATIAVAPGSAVAIAQDDTNDEDEAAPGEQLSGVLGVQQAEFEGDVDDRTFGIAVAKAASDDAKADVVGEQLDDVEVRLDELEQRSEDIQDARERGELTQGQYEARMAQVEAERRNAERLAERSGEAAGELPEDVLAERGISVEAIQTLQQRAQELSGPEVAEIAQRIAGPNVGASPVDDVGDAVPEDVGADTPEAADDQTADNYDADDGTAGADEHDTNDGDDADAP